MQKLKFDNSIYRLVISNLAGYGTFQPCSKNTRRLPNVSPALDALKRQVLDYLLAQQSKRKAKPTHWCIAWQVHPGSGLPHLDILLVFQRNITAYTTSFNYLIRDLKILQSEPTETFVPGHVWVTPYSSKKLNKAILDYGLKQDPTALTNLTQVAKAQIVQLSLLKADPYKYLYDRMKQDPLHFNLQQYVQKNQLSQHISSWSSLKVKLKDMQVAAANLALRSKRGFKFISRALIEANLNSQQLNAYDSWSGYQTIVDYLNQIVTLGGKRQLKTLNLLITGPASIGKTSLFHSPNHRAQRACVQDFVSVYPMGMTTWFPQYRSHVYKLILWNEAKLTSYSYDLLLKFLEGSYVDLPTKGGVAPKRDNPLIVMTSNLTLDQMIQQKFRTNPDFQAMARKNLAVRVHNVVVPAHYNLFLLQKLLVAA